MSCLCFEVGAAILYSACLVALGDWDHVFDYFALRVLWYSCLRAAKYKFNALQRLHGRSMSSLVVPRAAFLVKESTFSLPGMPMCAGDH